LRHKKLIAFAGVVAALLLAGCASPPERALSQKASGYASLQNGYDPLNPGQVSPIYAEVVAAGGNLIRQMERKKGRALNLLSLSGGGQNGAFGAGLLTGWRESGQRPVFDMVGGVSTGALLATHALLGTPADDAQLVEMYTQIAKKDVHNERGVVSLAFGADSLSDTAPLRALIARFITAETLKRVAAAYNNDDRFLFVGTTNIDYGQTWVWNMSLIAKDGNLELYRQVLLASASFPIVFPPVEIDGHLFVDGAARSNIVIAGIGGTVRPPPPPFGPGNIYLVDNGKLHSPPEALRRALGDVAATTVSVMMDQSMLTAMTRAYFGAKFLGYDFKMVAIPDNVNIGKDPLAFDPKQMRAAFDAGRAIAKNANHWLSLPPNTGDVPSWAFEQIK
jgi:outer membrane murein-binding lipoprotein Lpp